MAERMDIPDKCKGCEPAKAIACQAVSDVSERVGEATGIRVWGETSYAHGRVELEDAFRRTIDPSATDQAVRAYKRDINRVNQELYDQTNDCPGLQADDVCGKVVLANTANIEV